MKKRLTKGGWRRALEEEKEKLEEGCIFVNDEDSFEELLHWIDLRSRIDCFHSEWKEDMLEVCFEEVAAATRNEAVATAATE